MVLEPFLTEQWYLNVQPLADKAIAAVEQGRTKFVPENWAGVYFSWMRNIRPWCISRQLWWGHQIPIWYYFEQDEGSAKIRSYFDCCRGESGRPRDSSSYLYVVAAPEEVGESRDPKEIS